MQESPIFSRTHDMLLWLIPQVTRFPRAHRLGIGSRVTHSALDLHQTLLSAVLQPREQQRAFLTQADVQLAYLKQLIRLCRDMQLMSINQYEHAANLLVEIGRLLGGWLRSSVITGQTEGGAGGARRLVEQ